MVLVGSKKCAKVGEFSDLMGRFVLTSSHREKLWNISLDTFVPSLCSSVLSSVC